MPIQNAELLAALQDDAIISRAAGAGAIDALDALMKVNRTVPGDFRGVILAKKGFWHGFNGMDVDPPKPNDGTFLDDTGGLVGAGANFTALHKLAVQRRVQAGLKASGSTLDEAFLVDLINGDATNARTKLATKPAIFGALSTLTHPAAWDPATQDFLADTAVDAIKAQAKEQLLLNKIKNTAASKAEIEHLIAEAAAGTARFRVALQAAPWNLSGPTAGNLAHTDFTDAVKKTALEKGLALTINGISQAHLLDPAIVLATLNKDTANFKNDIGAPYTDALLGDPEIQKAKAQLGQRFLTAKLSQLGGTRVDDLAALAAQGSVADFARVLKTHRDLAGHPIDANNFVDHAITPTSLPILRQTAALQALKIKIAQCEDPAALDALIAATTKEQVKQVLTDKSAFGFSTSPAFREALNNLSPAQVNDIVAAAHVQKRLLAADATQLKAFVASPTAANDIQAYMGHNLSVAMQPKVTAHLTPERITEIREKALLGYAKTELVKPTVIDDGALDALVQAGDVNDVRDGVRLLMGGTEADGLITAHLDHDSGYLQQVRAYAAAEQVFRDGKALANLNAGDYDTLVDAINDLNGHPPQVHQQPLMAVLPPQEKQALQERMVTDLVSRFPTAKAGHPPQQLTALAVAKNEAEFATALTNMGITEQSWVNEGSRARVQEAACAKALDFQINATGPHPQLLALVKQLPLKKQQELLTKPDVMAALLNVAVETGNEADAAAKVRNILGVGSSVNVDGFIQENKNLALLSQIANPEVARILAQQTPPLTATPAVIQEINDMIHANVGGGGHSVFDTANAAGANYINIINNIKGKFYVHSDANFFAAFGLNPAGTALDGGAGALRAPIEQQHARNVNMLAKANGVLPTQPDYKLITFCTALKKTAPFTTAPAGAANNHYDRLKEDIQASASLEAFMTVAATRGGSYYGALDPAALRQQLTPEVFKQLKREQSRQILLENATYANNLTDKKREIDRISALFEKMKTADDKIRGELERFGNTKSIDWFNPAFHAAAKQNAAKLGPEFLEFAKGCDAFVTQLAHQKALIDEQLASLPSQTAVAALPSPASDAQKRDIEAYRKVLIDKGNLVGKELEHYQKMQKVLRGDPDSPNPLMQKGLVKTVEEAKEGKQDIRFHFDSECEPDRPVSEMAEFFKADWRGKKTIPAGVSTMSATGGNRPAYYHAVPVVAEGMVRAHRISYGGDPTHPNERLTGGFLEQRGADRGTPGKDGSMEYLPSIKLTVNAFPQKLPANPPHPETTDQALHEARVNFSMAMACQVLAGLHDAPTKDNPIILDGTDPKEMQYLWSGLVAMGKANPNMSFGPDAIKVISGAFQPKNEMGTIYGLSSNSLYEKGFKGSPALTKAESFFTEASGHKSGNQKGLSQTTKDLTKLSQMFKQDFQGVKRVAGVVDEVNRANQDPSVVSKTTPKLGG